MYGKVITLFIITTMKKKTQADVFVFYVQDQSLIDVKSLMQ